jgi:hypothetical protein
MGTALVVGVLVLLVVRVHLDLRNIERKTGRRMK